VTEGPADFAALQQKSAGHALDIASGKADKVAFEPGKEHALNAFGVEILAELGVSEAEGVVKLAAGVREARQVIKLVG
jgi:urease beta subunit